MAMYEYECHKCGTIQNKHHKIAEKNKESCINRQCNATYKDLQKLLSKPTHHGHGSWSRWNI